MDFDIRIFHKISEIDPILWDQISDGKPFTSHRWYRFGETVMSDCLPVYIFASLRGEMIARATFWVIRNEPVPINWAPERRMALTALRHWPLFICRSPIANVSGLILTTPSLRPLALHALTEAALLEAKKYHASFLLFDFLDKEQAGWNDWLESFSSYTFSDPGTGMEITWPSFNRYLESLNPKARKHYRQQNREAEKLGIKITRHDSVANIEEVLPLIQDVEIRHRSTPNPWTTKILENINLINAVWLTASMDDRIIGCEMVLEDNGTQMVTALGLANSVSHIYHLLGYADIQYAIERGARSLRWGSGSYDTKRRLGFELEYNNHVVFRGLNPLSRLVARMASS
jgi:predicted N-acyltransferase